MQDCVRACVRFLSPQTEVTGSWPVGQVMTLPPVPPSQFLLPGPPHLMIAPALTLTVVCVFLCGCLVIWVRGCSQANVNVCNLTEFLCSCSQYLIQLKALSMYGIQYFLMMHWWYGNRVSVWHCCHGGCAWSLRVFGQMVWIQWHINVNARVKVLNAVYSTVAG